MNIQILQPQELTDDLQNQISILYTQLNAQNKQRPLIEILEADNNVIVCVAKDGEKVIATALLSYYKVISGFRGMIEDVVVDEHYRGQGLGRKITERILQEAKTMGIDEVLLFTGHHRKAAIKLYTGLGFELRKSGIYNIRFN